ncbi:MAG: transposase [Gammaproteobacteria bacterium HGW-Gammaproteobacteria-11]|nr:MAG: transposase [Gammaproteobacteria bacterium HGW-Gammaproteobacteria-11]
MLKIKKLIITLGSSQADLARALELSPAAIAQLVNHSQWPKSIDSGALVIQILEFLKSKGATADQLLGALSEEVEQPRANAATPQPAAVNPEENTLESEPMLKRKQHLMPAARKAFGLVRDPFDDLQSADDLYVNPDIRYVRESMYQVARHDGFLAVVGESGAGKSSLRRDLLVRLASEGAPVVVIEPYVLAMEDNDQKGKTLKSAHIAEAIMATVAPLESTKSSPEARFRQLHNALKSSHQAGYRHVLIIEEAHSLPIPTLKQLKRLRELESGFTKLVSIILVGQPELLVKLSERNAEVREVVQRIQTVQLEPVPRSMLDEFLAFRFKRAGLQLENIIDSSGVEALADRLTSTARDDTRSLLYPLAIGNMLVAAMNLAAEMGETIINADVIREV